MDLMVKNELYAALRATQVVGPLSSAGGICHSVEGRTSPKDRAAIHEWLEAGFEAWPEYSGDIMYPVPSPHRDYTPADAYHKSLDVWIGPYGESHKRLLAFLIDRIEQELAA